MRGMQTKSIVVCRVCDLVAVVVGCWLLGGAIPLAAADSSVAASEHADRVELFPAIEAGEVEVTVIPQRAERVTLQIANKSDRPLAIAMPEALAAGPVLAQLPIFPGANNQNNANANAPQAVGFPGPANGQNNNGNVGPGFPMNPGFFNVPAGKTIKVRLPATCLEFGKREPHTRIAYELKPIATVTEREEVVTILSMVGRKEVSRRIGQLAIWNIANAAEWEELAKLQSDRIGGLVAPQYSRDEIRAARALVKKVTEPVGGERSLSRR